MQGRWAVFIVFAGLVFVAGFAFFSQETTPLPKKTSIAESPTPTVSCSLTPSLMEGPYYKTNSPGRTNLVEKGTIGSPVTLTGLVYDINCRPIAGAWLDFWQADGAGNYDNSGYKLRGHQYTDGSGKYILQTVIPGEYLGRTPHIHVKLRANEQSPVLTTQLFLPNAQQNKKDSIFNEKLVVSLGEDKKTASFNFVLK